MIRAILWIVAAALIAAGPASAATPPTVIHAGTLMDVPGAAIRVNQSVFIENGRIRAIEPGFVQVEGARIIDLSNAFVMPGLIDGHVHLQFGGSDYSDDLMRSEDGVVTLRAYAQARLALQAGFTTLRDLAGDPDVVFSLRDAINRGVVQGPRILASGRALVPSGGGIVHGLKLRRDVKSELEHSNLETPCDGPDDCARVTRRVIAEGADVIKVIVTGSILEPKLAQQMSDAEVEAIVSAARGMGRDVAAAALDPPSIRAAIRAGARTIEHGSFADEDSIDELVRAGVYLVPTLTSVELLQQAIRANPKLPSVVRENVLSAADRLPEVIRLAQRRGVKIAFGTDLKVGMLGQNAREFELLEAAGLNEVDILRSATTVAAEMIGLADQVGTLEIGKRADIIALARSPLTDITALKDVKFVMKEGEVVITRPH